MADKPKHAPPHGMEPYDLGGDNNLGALSQEQQEKLNKFKVIIEYFLEIVYIFTSYIINAIRKSSVIILFLKLQDHLAKTRLFLYRRILDITVITLY